LNHSGSIDVNELKNVAKALGHNLDDQELLTVFDELD
jgi:Ca2+-binding EF-hand superfamily protein